MRQSDLWADNGAHLLHFGGRAFPCDRDVEALARWKDHALLLSSDTDCLSLWDSEGLIRTARVGVYPQDVAVQGDEAWVCGGADGKLHRLALPELLATAEYPLPGMAERLCLHGDHVHVLTLLPEPEVRTALLTLDPSTGKYAEITQFAGLAGAVAADDEGLWVAVSELVVHLPWGSSQPDAAVEGFGLARYISLQEDGIWLTDPLEGLSARITKPPRTAITALRRGETDSRVFSR